MAIHTKGRCMIHILVFCGSESAVKKRERRSYMDISQYYKRTRRKPCPLFIIWLMTLCKVLYEL